MPDFKRYLPFILFSFVRHAGACYNIFQKSSCTKGDAKNMDNYNNGQIPPWQNSNSGVPPYYAPPTRHPGSGFATASMVLGILAILSAFTGTVFPPLICGGLSVILALLSKGNDRAMLPNAKVGVLTAVLGLVVNVLIVASAFLLLFTNPDMQKEFHDQLNYYYEYFYGESFDDAWDEMEDIYGGYR